MSQLSNERDRLVATFPGFAAARSANDPDWLTTLRKDAITRFEQLGFPSMKREDWKYTNVAPIAKARLEAPPPAHHSITRADVEEELGAGLATHALVFVNGSFAPRLSSLSALPDGVVVDALANAVNDRAKLAEEFLSRRSSFEDRCFVALNTAFQRDGAFVLITRGTILEEPLHLVFATTPGTRAFTSHLRNLILVGESASSVIVEHYIGWGEGLYLSNAVSEVELGANAQLDHVAVNRESVLAYHVGTLTARLGRGARFRSHSISLGAALTRNELVASLDADGAECVLNGLFMADGTQHVDHQTTIDHAHPHCTSRELYKGILGGRARGVFNGKVIVRPDAQKTYAEQSNANLLLSEGAQINARPNLEIHADDVKCSHGSTVGRLDEDALFFLRSRGIGEAAARQMLSHAFASEVIDKIPFGPLRHEIDRRVIARIDATASTEAA